MPFAETAMHFVFAPAAGLDTSAIFLATALAAAVYFLWRETQRTDNLTSQLSQKEEQLAAQAAEVRAVRSQWQEAEALWSARVSTLEGEVQRLQPWVEIANAAEQAAQLREQGEEAIRFAERRAAEITTEATNSANNYIGQATAEVRQNLDNSSQELRRARDEAKRQLDQAISLAHQTVEAARRQAEETAGAAVIAQRDASLYEQAALALKNLTKGYGDEYLIPERSLLDDLAEAFSHTEAGANLKLARDRTQSAIRNSMAATCDYVEFARKTTAIAFVTDAFNGKADSILSRVKSDNVGKLRQEILDARAVVNLNGRAFRNARITDLYLEYRLDELKWASIAQQLREEEREEQRRIRERLREEERARREYERALRDAAKEEEVIRKAMEKARLQIEQASEQQRAKYEAQLTELELRLKQAEERGQRALSMAQQTKRGHVYVISNIGSFGEHVYKIGLTRRLEPLDRIRELGDSSVPFEFDVHALIFSEDAPALEHRFHRHFILSQINKVNHRKEFFRVDIAYIRQELETLGINPQWTRTAEAREYRETLAIEKAIADNPIQRDAWVRRQLILDETTPDDEADIAITAAAGQ